MNSARTPSSRTGRRAVNKSRAARAARSSAASSPAGTRGGERTGVSAGQERRVPHFHHDADHRPLVTGYIGRHEPGQPRDLTAHFRPVLQILLEGNLPAPGPGHVGRVIDRRGIQAAGDLHQPWPGGRAELRGQRAGVGGRELPHGTDIQLGEPRRGLGANSPEHLGGQVTQHVEPVVVGQPEDTGWLAEAGGQLRLQLVPADPDRAIEPGSGADPVGDLPGRGLRIVGLQGQERLVPAHHLDDRIELVQRGHDLRRGRFVHAPVDGQEHGLRAAPRRGAQRQPGMHAVRACLVGSSTDHAALGRIAVAPDDDRATAQLGTAQQFDGRDELIEVHVQHPAGHATSLARPGARASAAAPSERRRICSLPRR